MSHYAIRVFVHYFRQGIQTGTPLSRQIYRLIVLSKVQQEKRPVLCVNLDKRNVEEKTRTRRQWECIEYKNVYTVFCWCCCNMFLPYSLEFPSRLQADL